MKIGIVAAAAVLAASLFGGTRTEANREKLLSEDRNNHEYAGFYHWLCVDGVEISHCEKLTNSAYFIIYKDGSIDIRRGGNFKAGCAEERITAIRSRSADITIAS